MAKETKNIRFTQSPTGHFGLGYNVGETGAVEAKLADECIEAGYAVEVKTNAPDKEAKAAAAKAQPAAENTADKGAAAAETA